MRHVVRVCAALLLVGTGATLVGPLFPLYQSRFALSHGAVAAVAATYAATIVPTILITGRLSDRWSRAALLWPGLGFFVLGDLAFALADGVGWLVAGRLLHGLAMGSFFGPSTALASDLAGAERPDLAALGATVASMVGFGIGPLVSGVLLHADLRPATTPFVLHALWLGLAGALLAPALRARPRAAAAPADATPLRCGREARRLAVLAAVGGWALNGVLLVMLAIILRPLAGEHWTIVGGLSLSALHLAGALAAVATRRWPPVIAVAAGALGEAVGFCLLVVGVAIAHLPLACAAVVLSGLGLTSLQKGGLGLSIRATRPERKGSAIALYLAFAYFAANVPVIAFGVAADSLGTVRGLVAYEAVFGGLLVGCALYGLARRRALQ